MSDASECLAAAFQTQPGESLSSSDATAAATSSAEVADSHATDTAEESHAAAGERSILLPEALINEMSTSRSFSVDIGGSLVKLVYLTKGNETDHPSASSATAGFSASNSESLASDESLTTRNKKDKDATTGICNSDSSTSNQSTLSDQSISKKHGEESTSTPIAPTSSSSSSSGSASASAFDDLTQTGVRIHFVKFETKYIERCIDFIRNSNLLSNKLGSAGPMTVTATGGGSYKYIDMLESRLGVQVHREDEMRSVITGCNFLLRKIPNEAFKFNRHGNVPYRAQDSNNSVFPYLLVNIGSGVSLVKVNSETEYERIGGTSLGGGTFLGLCSLLTKCSDFDEMLEMSAVGNHRNVDMLVGDIYGRDYSKIGLTSDTIASSFGKAARWKSDGKKDPISFEDGDIAKSLLHMISNNIGQIAYLHAKLHNLNKIYFGGFFIRGHPYTMHAISYAINFWSGGSIDAMFLRHEGYLGAIGAYILGATEEEKTITRVSWDENFAKSSIALKNIGSHVIEQTETNLVLFPLLDQSYGVYDPDVVDLGTDTELREYWLNNFSQTLPKLIERILECYGKEEDVVRRTEDFKQRFLEHLETAKKNSSAFGILSPRVLFDVRQQFLQEFHFPDPYFPVKEADNARALKLLPNWLAQLDSMNWEERQIRLIEGVLSGNMFDWDARAVVEMLEKDSIDFSIARKMLRQPWLVNDVARWIERLRDNHNPHKKVVIFADNSGVDLILGVLPLARELIIHGASIIIAANTHPAINDITFRELVPLLDQVASLNSDLKDAIAQKRLIGMASGSGSPCLDLRRIDENLACECENADLIIIVGMGRVIHTNFHAKFTSESLKLAVIKNQRVAQQFGGNIFDVVCKFDAPYIIN